MTQPQILTAPEAFSVFGIRFQWDEQTTRIDLTNLLNGFAFEFWMGQKYYQRANLRHFSSGMGVYGFSTRTSDAAYTNGVPDRNSMHKLQIPLVIANQMRFWAQLVGPNYITSANGNGFYLYCELTGLYARGVQ